MTSAPTVETTEASLQELEAELRRIVQGEVRFGRHDRMLYATDASLYQVEPIGVVIPSSVEDAHRAVAVCATNRVAVLPRGGGTSLAGQCANHAVVIDFSAHCRDVGPVDPAQRRVRAEPGVTLDELNEAIAAQGHPLFFAPDVATSRHANIGGMIGNNSAGSRSVLYGRTVEHVIGLDVTLVDDPSRPIRATLDEAAAIRDERVRDITERVVQVVRSNAMLIRERFPRLVRQSSGYNLDVLLDQIEKPGDALVNVNLSKLICGSEGTLAPIHGARLNLEPMPAARGLAIVTFDSVRSAIEAVNEILTTQPSAVELLDDMVISLARQNRAHASAVDLLPRQGSDDPKAALYVEYFAIKDARELADAFGRLKAVAGDRPMATFHTAADMMRAWGLRKAAEPLLHGLPGLRKPITFVEDTAVSPSRLPEFVERFRAIVESHGTRAAYFAHASVGCLHIRPLLDPHDTGDRDTLREIATAIADLVVEFGGALSGEHGDGRVRGPLLERVFGPEVMRAFREVKQIFDPANLLNPGNIVEPGPVASITTQLRVLPDESPVCTPDVETYFDYDDQHGFGGAVEMCNGAGVCRKKRGGTMCPSYMATLDERHSTRGRGNALRLAITGQFGERGTADWRDEETRKTLDLCLSCKACKSECPSNVDIARLKAEYTAQGRQAGERTPLRDRLLTRVRLLNSCGSAAPRVANAVQRNALIRRMMNSALGLAPDRSLPTFGRSLESRARREVRPHAPSQSRGAVALFVDCFTGYGESDIGIAAMETLGSLGYSVKLINAGCCQRPAISLGALEQAMSHGERMLQALLRVADDTNVQAILFLEPSCLSAVTDDLQRLRLQMDRPTRARIASQCVLADEFLAQAMAGRIEGLDDCPPVILHGHCHQKALYGVDATANLVRSLVGDRLAILDSGCCGMAGAFGMTRDRFELSMQIGELSLLPAVRAAPDDAIVLATGSSCRHQILDGTGRRAMHPVELAASMLKAQGQRSEDV